MTDQEANQAGWRPDPTWRYEFRWHNGTTWTADVSMYGQRFVDPLGAGPSTATRPGPPPIGYAPATAPPPRSDGRGMGIASFVVAISSALLAWIPFVFVLAAMGAITALVFGIVSTRAAKATGRNAHGMAFAGLVLSAVALMLCVVGFQFTRSVLQELDELAQAGPNEATITTCRTYERLVAIEGQLTNLDDVTQTFIVNVVVRGSSGFVERQDVSTGMVEPGETAPFEVTVVLDDDDPTRVTCEVGDVRGPSIFDPAP